MVVVSTRHVPADEAARAAFNKAHLAASNYMMDNISGTKAVFQSNDWDEVTMVHDVQWWDSLASFMLHVDPNNQDMQDILNDWVPKYDLSVPFKGHVFGGWNEELRNVSVRLLMVYDTMFNTQITVNVGGADFMMVPRSVGYIKQTGDGLDGPPVIVYNHRRVVPGLLDLLL